jgi:pimeloyl-ACP methyl ester carboxylesterase
MKKDVFISGWYGYSELFGDFADEFEFVLPFITHTVEDIEELLEEGGRNLFGWSTGTNIILNLPERPKYENIVLAAPFKKFTDYTPRRVLERMISRYSDSPDAVAKDFFKRCSCTMVPKTKHEYEVKFWNICLKYLLDSDVGNIDWEMDGVKLLHGTEDLIVNIDSGRSIAKEKGCELVELESVGHFIPPEILSNFKI